MPLRPLSVAVFFAQLVGYVGLSSALQLRFHLGPRDPARWKTQPAVRPTPSWALPLLGLLRPQPARGGGGGTGAAATGREPRRHPRHPLFATLNLLQAAAFAGGAAEAASRGATTLAPFCGAAPALGGLAAAFALQLLAEYAWHYAMHAPAVYAALHRHHHHTKAPQPFDDLLIHPAEACGYLCILYSPLMLVPGLWWGSFVAYMALHGVAGVADHSGVRLRLRLGRAVLYDAAEHDAHHESGWGPGVRVNLGFPTMWLDRLFGTYSTPAPGDDVVSALRCRDGHLGTRCAADGR